MAPTTFTARPAPTPRSRLLAGAVLALLVLAQTLAVSFGASAATTGSIAGRVFEDADRDGFYDAGEPAWADQGIAIYNPDGSYADGTTSGTDGTWRIDGLAEGTYRAAMGTLSWWEVRDDWVPTTTGGVFPEAVVEVTAGGVATFDLGWRLITWSTELSEPLSTATAADGVTVEAFNDAMHASDIVAALDRGTLRGGEASVTTVRFAYSSKTYCATTVSGSPGNYSGFHATCYVAYGKWLNSRDSMLFHEYGHAWSHYHRTIVNQWENFDPYLEARGIDPSDDRLYSSHAWTPAEMIAEDFRQLFGSSTAAAYPQENKDIPPSSEVPGLADWLSGPFMDSTGGDGDGGGTSDADTTSDTTAPALSGLKPASGTTVSGTVTASVSVSDDVSGPGGMDVTILLGGVAHVAAYDSGSGLWQASVDTTAVADGTRVLEARATDAAGNTATTSHEVVVDNTADTTPTPDGPAITAVTSGAVNLGGDWTGWIEVTVTDGGIAASGATVTATWAGEGKHAGSGTVTCVTDAAGQCTVSATQPKRVPSITFDTTAPSAVSVTVAKP